MIPTLILTDTRRRGFDNERTISGECSACGDLVMEQLDSEAKPNAELLRAKLQRVFEQHLAKKHPTIQL
ncbi:MAG: hypothetical protein WCB11_10785 [Terriglobales bacterium]|jgi:hypothetical protein